MTSVRIEPHRPTDWDGVWPPPLFRQEVEEICLRELSAMNLLPETPTATRIDRFIEKRFGIEIEPWDHGSLKHPGMTLFDSGGRPVGMLMNRELYAAADTQAERRARSTMAHEAGHAILHGQFFRDEPVDELSKPLRRNEPPAYVSGHIPESGDANHVWMEWQANAAIGGLLLPEHLVRSALRDFLTDDERLDMSRFQEAVQHLVDVFDVNTSAVRVRLLKHLFPYHARSIAASPISPPSTTKEARYERGVAAGIEDMWAFQRGLFEGPARARRRDREPESPEECELRRYESYWFSKECQEEEELERVERRTRWLARAIRRSVPKPEQLKLHL